MIKYPKKCPRKLTDCQPYAQIISDVKPISFFCCGENDGTGRVVEQDKYTLCFKNDAIDELTHNDKRDLTHMASVIIQALAIIECDVDNENRKDKEGEE